MKVLLYDCSSGISGDMNLGALVDLGVPQDYLQRELGRLKLDQEFTLSFAKAAKRGIWGTRAAVITAGSRCRTAEDHDHPHDHSHPHGRTGHDHGPVTRDRDDRTGHIHRRYRDIKAIIAASPYADRIKATTGKIFGAIAEAEAKMHGVEVDQVDFHEVGAIDSIVDIFGAAICLDYLGVQAVLCSAVELGSGFVDCAHGRLPVPAPATLEILKGVPCLTGGVCGEATTPTGAAILKATVHQFGQRFAITPDRIGYGIGERDFAIPNVLRVVVGETDEEQTAVNGAEAGNVEIIANIDDMSPESYEPLIERLFSRGASDVFVTPIIMKKSRPAHMISVLARAGYVDSLVQTLFEESTAIGVRLHPVSKRMLPRMLVSVPTSFGDVQVKIAELGVGGARRWKVEHDDVKRLAVQHGVPYQALRRDIDAEVRAHFATDTKDEA